MERNQGFSYALEDLEGVVAEIVRVGLKMNKRTHSLLMLYYFQDSSTDVSSCLWRLKRATVVQLDRTKRSC